MRTRIAFTAIATTAAFCTAPSTAACNGHDLSLVECKTLDARLFFLEGMLRDPTPNLPQMCETITDLARAPYARAAMLSDGVCEKFTRSFTSVPSLADLPPADQFVMACNTFSSLDVGSNCTSVVDDVTAKEYFENVNACAFLYSLGLLEYLADANATVAACKMDGRGLANRPARKGCGSICGTPNRSSSGRHETTDGALCGIVKGARIGARRLAAAFLYEQETSA
jgi:hypothetical protein